jgi:glutathione S-transferase
MAVHIALHEIGVPFETRSLSFHSKEHRTPEFRAINPAGKVPTLIVDGTPISEVAGCLLYLARRFPDAGLLPTDDAMAEAQAVSWMSFIASTLHPARRQGLEHVTEVWTLAERKLGGRDWCLGRYSIADIHLYRLYWRMVNAPHPYPKGLRSLESLYQRMMGRAAVQRTIEIESRIGYELPA